MIRYYEEFQVSPEARDCYRCEYLHASKTYLTYFTSWKKALQSCNLPIKKNSVSKAELDMQRHLSVHTTYSMLYNSRKEISPLALDIYAPELHKAIEINGTYWHNLEKDLQTIPV